MTSLWKLRILASGARNGARQQQKTSSGAYIVDRNRVEVSSKTLDITSSQCTRADTTTSTIILTDKRKFNNDNVFYPRFMISYPAASFFDLDILFLMVRIIILMVRTMVHGSWLMAQGRNGWGRPGVTPAAKPYASLGPRPGHGTPAAMSLEPLAVNHELSS